MRIRVRHSLTYAEGPRAHPTDGSPRTSLAVSRALWNRLPLSAPRETAGGSSAAPEPSMPKKKPAPDPPAFEDALAELQQIVTTLEDGSTGLEASLERFERGVGLLRDCYRTLENVERRIETLTGFDDDGQPVTEPFDATATAEQGRAGRRKAEGGSATDNAAPADTTPADLNDDDLPF